MTGAGVGRYSFTVRLFHPQHLADLTGARMELSSAAQLAGVMESLLDAVGAGKVVATCERLSSALEAVTVAPAPEVPEGVRQDVHRIGAVLAFPSWDEVVRWATNLSLDLRDLTERELAYLERVSVKLVQRWRTEGTGPAYRNEAGIRYSIRDYWDWRKKGRQTMTAQGCRRGRRRQDAF